MLNFNGASDMSIIRTIDNHDSILWQIGKGVKGYTEEEKHLVEKELAEMEAEMKRRYPDAV